MKKTILILLCIAAVSVTLSGCSMRGNVNAMQATTAPATMQPLATPNPTTEPVMTAAPMATAPASASPEADAGATAMTPAQAGKQAEQVAEAVERLSEVDDAEVVIQDNRALVAVEFDDQYSAGLDERMKKMITDAVQETNETLTEVSITDDDTIYGQVKGLGERFAKATGLDELADDFGDLWDRITGM